MALTAAQIDLKFEEVLSRHATAAEQAAFAALSVNPTSGATRSRHFDAAGSNNLVDPLIRLYQGAFGRLPDTIDPNGNVDTAPQSGFWVNTNALRSGVSLLGLAQAFVVSAEFNTLYGSTSVTAGLITAFYEHILARDPSSAEVAAWLATGLDAAHILIGFTQSIEFIARSQASVDAFKDALAEGLHPSGALQGPPPPPAPTLVDDHTPGGVNEGSTVTFTLQSTNPADFGKTFNYDITGSVSAADIVGGSLAGTVTLDATGKAFVAVTLVADATTEGAETLTLNVDGLTDTVTVNDTSTTPVTHNFTTTVGETLNGSSASDTFVGVVDRGIVNDQTTLSNIVDVANGGGGVDTEKVFVIENFFNATIEPAATSIEIFQVTDTPGTNFDMSMVNSSLQEIDEVNSNGSTVFNNVQSLVNIGLLNPNANGVDMTVKVANIVAGGAVGVTLENTSPTPSLSNVDIHYSKQNGADLVTDYSFTVGGLNDDVRLFNTTSTESIEIDADSNDPDPTSATLNLDLADNSNGLGALTSIDASQFQGALTMTNIGAVVGSALKNDLTVLGSQGDNTLTIHDANNAAIDVTTFDEIDKVTVTNQGTGKVTVSTGDGDGDKVTVSNAGNPSGDVSVTVGNGDGDAVTVTTGTNTALNPAKVDITAGSGTGDTINVTLRSWHDLTVKADGLGATINSKNFVGTTNMNEKVTADGGDASIAVYTNNNSPITIEATGTGVSATKAAIARRYAGSYLQSGDRCSDCRNRQPDQRYDGWRGRVRPGRRLW